jgi:hypothetical protein
MKAGAVIPHGNPSSRSRLEKVGAKYTTTARAVATTFAMQATRTRPSDPESRIRSGRVPAYASPGSSGRYLTAP